MHLLEDCNLCAIHAKRVTISKSFDLLEMYVTCSMTTSICFWLSLLSSLWLAFGLHLSASNKDSDMVSSQKLSSSH